jgi:hypothetical protein
MQDMPVNIKEKLKSQEQSLNKSNIFQKGQNSTAKFVSWKIKQPLASLMMSNIDRFRITSEARKILDIQEKENNKEKYSWHIDKLG